MASFAVVEQDQLMLVTNEGQIIRIRVHGGEGDSIRIASRKTLGVRLFDVADNAAEKVVSAGIVRETDDDEAEEQQDADAAPDGATTEAPTTTAPEETAENDTASANDDPAVDPDDGDGDGDGEDG
jgi:DNA gyrase subunit A